MQIRIRETGAVVYEPEFRALFPNTSLPQQLTEALINELGGDVVFEGPQATPTQYQTAFADGVEEINGKWYTKYSVADLDDEGKAALDTHQAKAIRATRDTLLAETDWRYRRDQTTTQAWDDYCQALRDIPAQSGFPWSVTWPAKPE